MSGWRDLKGMIADCIRELLCLMVDGVGFGFQSGKVMGGKIGLREMETER